MDELPPSIMRRVSKRTNGCWHWTGPINVYGYGQASRISDRTGRWSTVPAHRLAYEHVHGPLPRKGEPGHLQVDHECHNRSKSCKGGPACMHRRCVNPAHLVARKPGENTFSSPGSTASINRSKTHCSRGHELAGDNLGQNAHQRWCKTCHLARTSEARRKRLQAQRGEGWKRRYWQREVTHCPQGHAYSGDNLRIVPSTGQRQCRACLRDAQARYRARQREAH
jgi:hypothetical protein